MTTPSHSLAASRSQVGIGRTLVVTRVLSSVGRLTYTGHTRPTQATHVLHRPHTSYTGHTRPTQATHVLHRPYTEQDHPRG
jgi:hypothetical protein